MFKRILVALSGTPFTAVAVQHAIELARKFDAELTGVTVSNLDALTNVGPVPVGGAAAAHELSEYRQAMTEERVNDAIRAFELACRDAGIRPEVVHEQGDPFAELISLWRYHDLTILGLRGLFEYGIIHNPADQLIKLIRVGVRPLLAVSETHRPIRKVLIAYQGSMGSAKAMKQWFQMAAWSEAEVRIVCFDREPQEAETLLAQAASYCAAHGRQVEVAHVEGSPRDQLLDYAKSVEADLIVMGSTARSRMARYVLGDTALTAIRNAEIPLFIAR